MKFLLVILLSIFVTGCLSNRALNALGNASDRLSQYYMQRDLIERQNSYQPQRVYFEHEEKPKSGGYCMQLSDGTHCY